MFGIFKDNNRESIVLNKGIENATTQANMFGYETLDDNQKRLLAYKQNVVGNEPNFIKDKLKTGIVPYGYDRFGSRVIDALTGDNKFREKIVEEQGFNKLRQDAWHMYLGYPQKNNSFRPSKFQPEKRKDNNSVYYTYDFDTWDVFDSIIKARASRPNDKNLLLDPKLMGKFTIGKGYDKNGKYVSMYDKWDFPFSKYVPNGVLGKPFEIYDRFYEKDLNKFLNDLRDNGKVEDYDTWNRMKVNLDEFFNYSDLSNDEYLGNNSYSEALLDTKHK